MWVFAVALALAPAGCAGSAKKNPAVATQAPGGAMTLAPPEGNDRARLVQAVELIDEGKLDAAIKILEELWGRHPNNAIVLHELALAHRLAKRPQKAAELLMPHRERLPPTALAALGSALDELGADAEAISVLRAGLARFPRSGLLHSELATTLLGTGKFEEAFRLYDKGTQVDPASPPNYLHLARLLAESKGPGMTLIYGEMFRLLEPHTPRSRDMAALMVAVCGRAVKIKKKAGKDFDATISLAPDIVIEGEEQVKRLPLVNVLELSFGPGLVKAHIDGFNLASLHGAREALLAHVNKPGSPFDWSSVPLFQWLRSLHDAGHLEAYDYWLYGPAMPNEYERWAKAHAVKMRAMAEYLATHALVPPG
jgi:tetratricopeptide (TPR) repeat protein